MSLCVFVARDANGAAFADGVFVRRIIGEARIGVSVFVLKANAYNYRCVHPYSHTLPPKWFRGCVLNFPIVDGTTFLGTPGPSSRTRLALGLRKTPKRYSELFVSLSNLDILFWFL